MKKLIFYLALSAISVIGVSQTTFQKSIGGIGIYSMTYSIEHTFDGGYVIAGQTSGIGVGGGAWDFYLIKIDSTNNIQWTKTYGGAGYDVGGSVKQTSDGGFILTGFGEATGGGGFDVFLIRTDDLGNLLWTKTFGGPIDDYGNHAEQTADGGFILTGILGDVNTGDFNLLLIKTDDNGDTLWTRTFGGLGASEGYYLQQTTDGGYVVAGQTNSFGAGGYDIYVVKTDSAGNLLWSKTYGGSGDEMAICLKNTSDGGFIISGQTESFGVGIYNVYIIKADVNGNALWSKTYGMNYFDYGGRIQETTDGGYIIVTTTERLNASGFIRKPYLIKIDSIGSFQWSNSYGGMSDDVGNAVQQNTDGGYIITGSTISFATGSNDVYLIRTDSLGGSNCNYTSISTTVTSPATQVANAITVIGIRPDILTSAFLNTNSGGSMNTICTSVGIDEIKANKFIKAFPNPSDGNFVIGFYENIEDGIMKIYNSFGEMVLEQSIFNTTKTVVQLKNCPDGAYCMQINDGHQTYFKKVIIKNN